MGRGQGLAELGDLHVGPVAVLVDEGVVGVDGGLGGSRGGPGVALEQQAVLLVSTATPAAAVRRALLGGHAVPPAPEVHQRLEVGGLFGQGSLGQPHPGELGAGLVVVPLGQVEQAQQEAGAHQALALIPGLQLGQLPREPVLQQRDGTALVALVLAPRGQIDGVRPGRDGLVGEALGYGEQPRALLGREDRGRGALGGERHRPEQQRGQQCGERRSPERGR